MDETEVNVKLALLIEQTKDIPEIRRDVTDIKGDLREMTPRVKRNENDIETLQKRSDGWNVLNSIGVFVAGLIAWLRGG